MTKNQMAKVAKKLGVEVKKVETVMCNVSKKNPNYNTMSAKIKNKIGYYYLVDIKNSELKKYHNQLIKDFIEKNQEDYMEDTKTFITTENNLELIRLQNDRSKDSKECSEYQKNLANDISKKMDTMCKQYNAYVKALVYDEKSDKALALNCYEYQVAIFLGKIGVVPTTIAIDNFIRAIGGTGKTASVENENTFVSMTKEKYVSAVIRYMAQVLINKNLINTTVLKENKEYVAKIKDVEMQEIANNIQELFSELPSDTEVQTTK